LIFSFRTANKTSIIDSLRWFNDDSWSKFVNVENTEFNPRGLTYDNFCPHSFINSIINSTLSSEEFSNKRTNICNATISCNYRNEK